VSAISSPRKVEYPESDGQPMAETPTHLNAIVLLHQALVDFFQNRSDVFIASDIFWYWKEGDPNARISPDVMVAVGVPDRLLAERSSFFTWEENGVTPSVVFEMASRSTWREDLGEKYWRYEELGVREYFLFDPLAEHLVPSLQGFRLNRSAYRRLLSDDDVLSSELGFKLRPEGTMLRLFDGRTGELIPTREERAERERLRADAEKQRADALQAELDRLKAQLQPPPPGNSP
jgi:Uma2 family endonuclease